MDVFRTSAILGFISLALQSGSSSPSLSEWLEIGEGPEIKAHDLQSGVLVSYTTVPVPEQYYRFLEESNRILTTSKGQNGDYRWELLELSDPHADVNALVEKTGQTPSSGSWARALFEAYRPPNTCDRQVLYLITTPDRLVIRLAAVPCSAEQRARLQIYFQYFISGVRFHRVNDDRYGQPRVLAQVDIDSLVPGMEATSIAAEFGAPVQVWPNWPDGFTWLYHANQAVGAFYIAIDFGRNRTATAVRRVSETQWK